MWQHHIPLKHYLLKTLSNCQTFALLTVGFFTFNVLEFIPKFITELHALQCLFVRRYNKKKKGGGGWQDYFKFHKRRDFFITYDNHVLLRKIS